MCAGVGSEERNKGVATSASVCSSDMYFCKGVYLRKSSLNVSYTFPRIHFINLLIK
jgi:hypothetical protein